MIVGLTGGIGSGKTAVSDWFATQGVAVMDADVAARQVTKQQNVLVKLQESFGDWVLTDSGDYNRAAMRDYVFERPDRLQQLNTIIHPAIYTHIFAQLQKITTSYALLVVPLLFENRGHSPLFGLCQRFLLVDSPVALQKSRATLRDGRRDIGQIMAGQLQRQERLAIAQKLGADIVVNDQSLAHLYAKLVPLHALYLSLSANPPA